MRLGRLEQKRGFADLAERRIGRYGLRRMAVKRVINAAQQAKTIGPDPFQTGLVTIGRAAPAPRLGDNGLRVR